MLTKKNLPKSVVVRKGKTINKRKQKKLCMKKEIREECKKDGM